MKKVAETIGLAQSFPTIEEIEKIIRSDFESDILQIVAQRVFDRTTIKLAVSIQKKVLHDITSEQELEQTLIEESKSQTHFAEEHLSEEKIKSFMSEELETCKKALESNDIKTMLRMTQGKRLIAKLATLTGARNTSDFARACAKHISVEEIEELKSLKDKLLKQEATMPQQIPEVIGHQN